MLSKKVICHDHSKDEYLILKFMGEWYDKQMEEYQIKNPVR